MNDESFQTDVTTRCLTNECADCTGSYVNKILQHRWLCCCRCHKAEKALAIGEPETDAIRITQPSTDSSLDEAI